MFFDSTGDVDSPWAIAGLGVGQVGPYQAFQDGSLGVVLPGDDPRYPWITKAKDTQALQFNLSQELESAGLCPISMDGQLGPITCGAVDWSMDSGNRPPISTCEAHRASSSFKFPASPPCARGKKFVPTPPPGVPLPPIAPPVAPPAAPPVEPPSLVVPAEGSKAGLIVAGLLLVVGGTAAYMMTKKKRR